MPAPRETPDPGAEPARSLAQRLSDWTGTVLLDVEIIAAAPARELPAGRWIGLYPMALEATAGTRGAKGPPLQFGVRCLVTAAQDDDLFALAFHALDTPELGVDLEPLAAEGWLAFGAVPRPSFVLSLPMRKTRLRPVALPVRVPLVITPTPLVVLMGAVLGPGDIGVAGAKVELGGLGLSAMTDPHGRFRFGGVPGDRALLVRVSARGSQQAFEPGTAAGLRGPLQLRMIFS